VNHIQVNPDTNLTFAQGLRSIVRQDPDIILVGEIRDEETAEISVNAALTGHLLLSTFHTNDAATAIPRLLYMGVEPFLLASTLELVVSQRLVRKICEVCRFSVQMTMEEMKKILPTAEKYFTGNTITTYSGKGCQSCGGTGYKGRTAIYELIHNSQELQDLVLKHPSKKDVWKLARSQGAHSLFEDGIQKINEGLTTVKELLRVAQPEE
jgi:type II secretory ATPase GspE/PulE/Tfp pilus assembly ATPase PilB-like protein